MTLPIHFLDRSELAFAIDPEAPPRLVVPAPCEVMVETHDARSGKVKRPEDEALTAPVFTDRFPKTNPATGPIRVEGAAPGDTLVVEVLRIDLDQQGFVMVKPDAGLITGLVNRTETTIVTIEDNHARFGSLHLPIRPMIGVMACAPEEAIATAYIGRHGGNMDNNRLTVGTRMHLPVRIPGAQFYVGDLHATMGDGEISGSGVEIGGRVHLRLSVETGAAREWPWMETDRLWITTAAAPRFEEAAQIATRSMMELMQDKLAVTASEAFALLSIAGDLKVNQLCLTGIGSSARMEFPKANAGFRKDVPI
jgi:amidase